MGINSAVCTLHFSSDLLASVPWKSGISCMTTTKAKPPIGAIVLVLRTVVVAALLCSGGLQAEELDVISVGIVPQQNASRLALTWRPILSHLEENTGLKLQFKTAPSIPVFEERVAKGRYDIVYMNPY